MFDLRMIPTTSATTLVAAGFIGIFLATPTLAAPEHNCAAYATKAVEQQKQNQQLGCGFTDIGWSLDYNAHFLWCQRPDVNISMISEGDAIREKAIADCHADKTAQTTKIMPLPVLTVKTNAAQDTCFLTESCEFTAVVTNSGWTYSGEITVTDWIPSHGDVKLKSVTKPWACAPIGSGAWRCKNPSTTLQSGQSTTLRIGVEFPRGYNRGKPQNCAGIGNGPFPQEQYNAGFANCASVRLVSRWPKPTPPCTTEPGKWPDCPGQ
jgi:hypothetical protein